jgi:hypothetical protein
VDVQVGIGRSIGVDVGVGISGWVRGEGII